MSVSLDSITRSYLGKNGYNTLHNYVGCLRHLLDFLRKVSLNHAVFDKTVVLRLDEKKAVAWPQDYVTWNKIGWQKGDRIIAFQKDNTINLHHSLCEDEISATENDPYDINTPWPYNNTETPVTFDNYFYQNGIGYLQAYGTGFSGIGYFKPNEQAREFQFSSDVPQDFEIYLEYKTNGFSPTTRSVVPEVFAKLGEDYIHWQMAVYDKRLGAASPETMARELNYKNEYNEVLKQLNPISVDDIIGAKARAFHVNKLTA